MKTEENEQPAMTYCEFCEENYDELEEVETCNYCDDYGHNCQFRRARLNDNGLFYHNKCLAKTMTLEDFLEWELLK